MFTLEYNSVNGIQNYFAVPKLNFNSNYDNVPLKRNVQKKVIGQPIFVILLNNAFLSLMFTLLKIVY